jgi:hypothetical protein
VSYPFSLQRLTTLTAPPSTAENQVNSPLLRLPPELRNRIYSFVFAPRVARVIYLSTNLSYTTWPLTTLGVCRQIRFEASPILFANITFDLRAFKYGVIELEILALGPFESITVNDGTSMLVMDEMRGWRSSRMGLGTRRFQSMKRIYVTAFGAEVELVFDKESGLRKYGV